tara:strand:+ start:1567 stop:1818 length:252 start_codon:yes stop_codon:yes gene_type:complete
VFTQCKHAYTAHSSVSIPFQFKQVNILDVAAKCKSKGLIVDAVDSMIAAIVKSQTAAIATRNTKDFEGCGFEMFNPWKVSMFP